MIPMSVKKYILMNRLLLTAACIICAECIILVGPVAAQNPAWPNPMPKGRHAFTVVSHRGDHTHAPENTLAAYANAIEAGADYVEIDLRTTADSQLVIMHDGSVNRMTNDSGPVKDMSWAKLHGGIADRSSRRSGKISYGEADAVILN